MLIDDINGITWQTMPHCDF